MRSGWNCWWIIFITTNVSLLDFSTTESIHSLIFQIYFLEIKLNPYLLLFIILLRLRLLSFLTLFQSSSLRALLASILSCWLLLLLKCLSSASVGFSLINSCCSLWSFCLYCWSCFLTTEYTSLHCDHSSGWFWLKSVSRQAGACSDVSSETLAITDSKIPLMSSSRIWRRIFLSLMNGLLGGARGGFFFSTTHCLCSAVFWAPDSQELFVNYWTFSKLCSPIILL